MHSLKKAKRASTLPQVENGFLVASAHIDTRAHPLTLTHTRTHTHTPHTRTQACMYVEWIYLLRVKDLYLLLLLLRGDKAMWYLH